MTLPNSLISRLRPVPDAPIAPIPGSWLAAGAAFSALALAFLLAGEHLVVEPFAPGNRVILASLGLIAAVWYALRQPRDQWQRIARDYCEYIALFVMVCLMGAVASYPAAAVSHGFSDVQLERVDQLFGFDWLSLYNFVADRPWLQHAERLAYASIYVTPALLLGHHAISGQRAEARRFIAAFWLAAILTLFAFQLFPAVGPLATLDHAPLRYMPASALYQSELIPLLRAHMVHQIDLGALHGLVCAPSFHTTSAVLYTWAAWPIRRLRWPLALLNLAMLASTPVEGTHYLADMIAGAAVALLALTAMTALARWLAARSPAGVPVLTLIRTERPERLAA